MPVEGTWCLIDRRIAAVRELVEKNKIQTVKKLLASSNRILVKLPYRLEAIPRNSGNLTTGCFLTGAE